MEGNRSDLEGHGRQDEHESQRGQRGRAGLEGNADGLQAGAAAQAVEKRGAVKEDGCSSGTDQEVFESRFRTAGIPFHVSGQQIAGDGQRFKGNENADEIRGSAEQHRSERGRQQNRGIFPDRRAALLGVTPADQQRQECRESDHGPEGHGEVVRQEGAEERALNRSIPLESEQQQGRSQAGVTDRGHPSGRGLLSGQIDQQCGDHRQQNRPFRENGGGVQRQIQQIARSGHGLSGEQKGTHLGHGGPGTSGFRRL